MLWTARTASFLAATSLFLLQPLVARALVPLYGGTSWIWIAVSVFFQLSLIAGYFAATRLSGARRSQLHARVAAVALVLATAGFALLFQRTTFAGLPTELAVFLHLFLTVGAVAVYLAMTSPLLQIAIEADARIDVHRLYAWSNAGSLAGLIIYPTGMESFVPLRFQMIIWLALAASASLMIHRTLSQATAVAAAQPVQWRFPGRGTVIFVSAVAGALTIAVTTRLTIDLGALPLLWVLPLIMLLLSFVVAFGDLAPRQSVAAAAPLAVALACYLVGKTDYLPPLEMVLLWCSVLFVIQCGLQTRIRSLAPAGAARGAFYVALAVGGFAGSFMIGCLLPYYWDTASLLASTPITGPVLKPLLAVDATPELGWCLVAAAFALINTQRIQARDVALAVALGVVFLLIANVAWEWTTAAAALAGAVAMTYLPAVARRPSLYAVAVAAIIASSAYGTNPYTRDLARTRNVYGVLITRETVDGGFMEMYHGTTLHGVQYAERNAAGVVVPRAPDSPLTYFHPASAIGEVFQAFAATGCPLRAGILGLGAGALAGYAKPGDTFEFYEIDPAVIAAAEGPHFSYVSAARQRGATVAITEGDGRQTLATRSGPKLDLIVFDAFSSDAVPAHLLTLEAFQIAERQLAAGGYIVFNTTNRYFDVDRVVAANATRLGWRYTVRASTRRGAGTSASLWVIVRPTPPAAGSCNVNLLPSTVPGGAPDTVWTDDFSNPLRLLKAQGLWRKLTGNAAGN